MIARLKSRFLLPETWIFLLLLALIYFPLFLHLGSAPVRIWDESLYGVSALEMDHTGDWIVKTYDLKPDLWSVKPPFVLWLQVLSFKIWGYTEFALRFPVALSGLLLCLLLYDFCVRDLGNRMMGFLTAAVLVSSQGYIQYHVVRTGDPDGMLVSLLMTAILCFYRYLYREAGNGKWLWFTVLALILAGLTKGVASLFFLPFMAAWVFVSGQWRSVLKDWRLYAGIGLWLLCVPGYYLLRESQSPGYLDAVWRHELFGRAGNALEGHEGPFTYYWGLLHQEQEWGVMNTTPHFQPWLFMLPLGLLAGWKLLSPAHRPFVSYLLLLGTGYFLVISSAATKLEWYDAPLMPLLSLLTAAGLSWVGQQLWAVTLPQRWRITILACTGLALLYAPYALVMQKVFVPKEKDVVQEFGPFMKRLAAAPDGGPRSYSIYHSEFSGHVLFYQELYNWHHNYEIHRMYTPDDAAPGRLVMTCDSLSERRLDSLWQVVPQEAWHGCRLARIVGPAALPDTALTTTTP